MTGAHNLFCLYALVKWPLPPAKGGGDVEDFDFVSAVPQSNHRTAGTASWQNHDSPPPQSAILLHCHVCLCLSNTYMFPPHYGDNVKVKSQYICQAIPALLRGMGEAQGEGYSIFIHTWARVFFGGSKFWILIFLGVFRKMNIRSRYRMGDIFWGC